MNRDKMVLSLIEKSRELERNGELAAAIQHALRAVQLAHSLGDADGEASADAILAYAHIRLGHYAEARRLCQLALDLAGGDSPARAEALLLLGTCASETDDLVAAEDYFRQAVDLSRQTGDDRILVRGLHNLSAGIYMPRGQFALSLAADEECVQITRRRGIPELAWGPLTTINWIHLLMGNRRGLEANLAALREAARPGSIAEGYWHFIQARLAADAGDFEGAKNLLTPVRSSAETGGLVELGYLYRLGMSQLNRCMGNFADGLAWAEDTLNIAKRISSRHFQGAALIERGRAGWTLNDMSGAEADFRAAMTLLASLELNFDVARAALFLAALLHQERRPEAADAWREAAERMQRGGFAFLIDQERSLALPLLAAYLNHPNPALAAASQDLLERLQRAPLAPLKATTLGGLRAWVGGRPVEKAALRQRKAGELLALLLTKPDHCLAIEQALEALWPERQPGLSLPLLHQASSTLRRALEPDLPDKFPSRYVSSRDGQISLHLPEGSQIDFEGLEACCRNEDWKGALALYQGDFLSEFIYADWAAATRQKCLYLYQQALLAWAGEQYQKGQYPQAFEACQRALESDPWQEQAVLLGMHACLEMGNRSAARRLYRNLEKTLREELDAEPQAEIQALYRSLGAEPRKKRQA